MSPALSSAGLNRGQPLGPQIAARLGCAVAAGDLAPGLRLPGEFALARAFGVSRATMREALAELRAAGVIASRRGKTGGTFVRAPAPPEAAGRLAPSPDLVSEQDPVPALGQPPAPTGPPAPIPRAAAGAQTPPARASARHGQALLTALIALEKPLLLARARRRYRGVEHLLFREIVRQSLRELPLGEFAHSFERFHRTLLAVAGAPDLAPLGGDMALCSTQLLDRIGTRPAARQRIAGAHTTLALGIQRGDRFQAEAGFRRLTAALGAG